MLVDELDEELDETRPSCAVASATKAKDAFPVALPLPP